MTEEQNTHQNGNEESSREFFQSTTTFGIMLITFLAIFLMALFTIMTQKTLPSEGYGREAFGPASFPEIFGVNQIEGLDEHAAKPAASSTEAGKPKGFMVSRPPFSEGIFPCSNCHEGLPPDETVRVIGEPHENIQLNHGSEERWCLDCHDSKNRDVLRLANGKPLPFEDSYRLCGQCHGDVYRDWKLGIHGKRTGYWNGPKLYLLCVHCHNPHSPKFKPITPIPPPVRPDFLRTENNTVSSF